MIGAQGREGRKCNRSGGTNRSNRRRDRRDTRLQGHRRVAGATAPTGATGAQGPAGTATPAYAANISVTNFDDVTVTHNLGKSDVVVALRNDGTGEVYPLGGPVFIGLTVQSANQVQVSIDGTGTYRVVVLALP